MHRFINASTANCAPKIPFICNWMELTVWDLNASKNLMKHFQLSDKNQRPVWMRLTEVGCWGSRRGGCRGVESAGGEALPKWRSRIPNGRKPQPDPAIAIFISYFLGNAAARSSDCRCAKIKGVSEFLASGAFLVQAQMTCRPAKGPFPITQCSRQWMVLSWRSWMGNTVWKIAEIQLTSERLSF